MPETDWTPPSRIDESGLRVTVTNEGTTHSVVVDLTALPGSPELRRELANALATKTGPTGTWKRVAVVENIAWCLETFTAHLAENGIVSIAALTPGAWNAYRLHLDERFAPKTATHILSKVVGLLRVSPLLPDAMAPALRMRQYHNFKTDPQPTYKVEDFEAIQKAAQHAVHAAARRITANSALLAKQGDPSLSPEQAQRAAALQTLLDNDGYLHSRSNLDVFAALGATTQYPNVIRGKTYMKASGLITEARAALFLTPAEATACAALLICHEGYNYSVVHNLTVPDRAATAADTQDAYRTPTDKPRRGKAGRHQTDILVDDGEESVGRAIRWIREATEPARRYLADRGTPTDRLLLYWPQRSLGPASGIPDYVRDTARTWWPEGVPKPGNWAMLHRTHVTRIRRRPEHHSRRTFVNEYLLLDQAAREEANGVIRQGLESALRPAVSRLAIRIVPSDTDVPEDSDTAVASCADYDHHPRTGVRCDESFLMCLRCDNAKAGPRHVKRIVLLHDALANLRSAIDSETWEERFQGHYLDLVAFLRNKLTEDEIGEARRQGTDEDRRIIEALLRGEYDRR
ncbi:hypothetical protein [Modestobacter roseus]|uniref:hypothetical protein n=1 Tax=Modestobacter roseus TaxID=1181884 RepID=UPI0012955BDF|nr:hypothetical protein [Modestobacter roseus]MQA35928.1 hypothetical protein [Modestobacter roseus]